MRRTVMVTESRIVQLVPSRRFRTVSNSIVSTISPTEIHVFLARILEPKEQRESLHPAPGRRSGPVLNSVRYLRQHADVNMSRREGDCRNPWFPRIVAHHSRPRLIRMMLSYHDQEDRRGPLMNGGGKEKLRKTRIRRAIPEISGYDHHFQFLKKRPSVSQ
jgi:hypothetical protein